MYERRLAMVSGLLLLCGTICLVLPAAADDTAPPPPAVPQSAADQAATKPAASPVTRQIAHWEDQFFTRQYADEDVDKRLCRIEQLVFGTIETGSDEERIAKLKAALNQPSDGPAVPAGVAEFLTPTNSQPAVQAAAAAASTPAATTGGSTAPASSGSPAQPRSAVPAAVNGIIDDKDNSTTSSVVKSLNLEDKPVRMAELHVSKKQFDSLLKPQRVIQNLSEAIRDNPKDPELVYQRAKAYIQLDKLDKALSDLSDAIESQPNRSDFYLARAWVYHLLGNAVMADLDLSRARFVDPRFAEKVDWED